ncbi:hypothetical protein HPP92_013158 [Vanilla planifolia]|uniref:UDP-3-O-acyl-N-acetylglucosamine deacetylase n=1 Tax=Vanilla planifolia TaxID=51239 RepID=A0A835UW75_VANPL|nr:hypothetical protein HPP92_013158 [Vanilla planifolia]
MLSARCCALRCVGVGQRCGRSSICFRLSRACDVDNCRIEIKGGDEVPILDGSAKGWVEAIKHVGTCDSIDCNGKTKEKMAPMLCDPMYVCKRDPFIVSFPSSKTHISCGINFSKAPAIGCQWFSFSMGAYSYSKEIAPSRTFCIYEEVQQMRNAGLIRGGSTENAILCSAASGWINPPLRFNDEPCRHKILDLIGDFSLFARNGNQGVPLSHIISYKAGHSLHYDFVLRLAKTSIRDSFG